MRLFLVNVRYPYRPVASQVGCAKDSWKYKSVGRLPVQAENPVHAAEMILAHLSECMPETLRKHCASFRLYVSEHPNDSKPGIKFTINGNPDLVYKVRFDGTTYWPVYEEE